MRHHLVVRFHYALVNALGLAGQQHRKPNQPDDGHDEERREGDADQCGEHSEYEQQLDQCRQHDPEQRAGQRTEGALGTLRIGDQHALVEPAQLGLWHLEQVIEEGAVERGIAAHQNSGGNDVLGPFQHLRAGPA